MYKTLKKIKGMVLLLIFLVTFNYVQETYADSPIPNPSDLLYVTDNAQVLSTDVVNYILEQNEILYEKTGAQIAILTIDFIPEGYDSETYSYAVFDQWGIGSAEKNNGILILLVPGEGKFWITQGSGLINSLSSGTIDNIINNYLADDFDAGRYDEAVSNTFDALLNELDRIYGYSSSVPETSLPNTNNGNANNNNTNNSNSNSNNYYNDNPTNKSKGNFFGDIVIPFGIFIGIFFFTLRYTGLARRPRKRYYGGYFEPRIPRPRPFYIPWWLHHHHDHHNKHHDRNDKGPNGPIGGGPSSFGGGGSSKGTSSSSSRGSSSFGGGSTRGGGAGRSSTTSTRGSKGIFGGGSSNPFGGGSSRGGFGNGSRGGSFGGGSSRGGGAGRK